MLRRSAKKETQPCSPVHHQRKTKLTTDVLSISPFVSCNLMFFYCLLCCCYYYYYINFINLFQVVLEALHLQTDSLKRQKVPLCSVIILNYFKYLPVDISLSCNTFVTREQKMAYEKGKLWLLQR